ncbi:MAG TPA: T9SS type A sorting domain-containing protein, partial [Flavisolibacter sp.]|nr:T9SS type A sorting domain-containing protein [Flavisolibacter sp.]
LNWETVNETNTSWFEVERSTDGVSFAAIGKVSASGNNSDKRSYAYTDAELSQVNANQVYYRLKMVDKDGSFDYSKVLRFPITQSTTLTIFPNPVQHTLTVSMTNARYPLTLQVTDLSGRVLYTEKLWRSAASINVGRWKSQVYLLKVLDSDNQLVATQKFEKIN